MSASLNVCVFFRMSEQSIWSDAPVGNPRCCGSPAADSNPNPKDRAGTRSSCGYSRASSDRRRHKRFWKLTSCQDIIFDQCVSVAEVPRLSKFWCEHLHIGSIVARMRHARPAIERPLQS